MVDCALRLMLEDRNIKVDSFMNHQIDPVLMREIGEEFARRFRHLNPTRILTAETSGMISLGSETTSAHTIAAEGMFGVSILGERLVEAARIGAAKGVPKFVVGAGTQEVGMNEGDFVPLVKRPARLELLPETSFEKFVQKSVAGTR